MIFEPIAAAKPPQLNVAFTTATELAAQDCGYSDGNQTFGYLTSDIDAAATPPTIGNKLRMISNVGLSPRNIDDNRTEKKGSIA